MRSVWVMGLLCVAGSMFAANGPGGANGGNPPQVSLHIPNEMAPPGGLVQMKFMVTEPTPISTGKPGMAFDPTIFDGVFGIELFNPTGDVNGIATIKDGRIELQYITSTGPSGTDYPIMTVALHIRPDAAVGTQMPFNLDASSTWILGPRGAATPKPQPPATITVGGTISIVNVVPGGGSLPAGTVVSIRGMGFGPETQVQLNNLTASSIEVVSPEEIRFALAAPTDLTGKKIQVVNPDGSQDTYFCYLRGIPMGQSKHPLLATAVPIFSSVTHSFAAFAPVAKASASQFTGIAVQNPNLQPVTATVSLYSSANVLAGSSTITLPSGYRITREISELTAGVAPQFGSYLVISATAPVQVFGFTADTATGLFSPFTAVVAR